MQEVIYHTIECISATVRESIRSKYNISTGDRDRRTVSIYVFTTFVNIFICLLMH